MGHTNETNFLKLPQFVYNDEGTWLGDLNGAFQAIDSNAAAEHSAITSAAEAASNAMQTANAASASAAETAGKIVEAETDIDSLVGTVNTITSLIGNGAPTTEDKTIIGAINELHADIEDLPTSEPTAADISFAPPTGMTARNVQDAIEELADASPADGWRLVDNISISTSSAPHTFSEDIEGKELLIIGYNETSIPTLQRCATVLHGELGFKAAYAVCNTIATSAVNVVSFTITGSNTANIYCGDSVVNKLKVYVK